MNWRLARGKNKVVRETKSTYKDGQRHCSRTDPRGRKYRPAYPIKLALKITRSCRLGMSEKAGGEKCVTHL